MNVRWRLAALALQLAVLCLFTYSVTGRPFAAATWFGAGMLALIVNPQLLEPYYPRPGDVLGNCILALGLYFTATKATYPTGWRILFFVLVVFLILGLVSLLLGAGRTDGRLAGVGRAATIIGKTASSRVIYSAVFWLALLEFRSPDQQDFWVLGGMWATITIVGVVNWQAAWGSFSGGPVPCKGEGMIGPALLLVTAPALPPPGTPVLLRADACSAEGVVLARIHRGTDFWGQVHVENVAHCEILARKTLISISNRHTASLAVVGVVLPPSTDVQLQFVSTMQLEIGRVVAVRNGATEILFQIRAASIEEATVRGGAHQVVRAFASQVGVFDQAAVRLVRYRWVPSPGGAVFLPTDSDGTVSPPAGEPLLLGHLVGTRVPVFLDGATACEGHLAILGMTRMGKTRLALRLAATLSKTRRVTILDQTGEWVGKKGLAAYSGAAEDSGVGLSVIEPKPGTTPADEALKYLQSLVKLAYAEYKVGDPLQRVLIIDEAHQFVPEPAGMGFNSPGRDSAAAFGLLMMQVRKYGISIVLISQRTAVVAKSALSQCENLIAFKSVDQTGLEYLEAILGSDARKLLPALSHAEALVFGPAISADTAVGITVSAN